MNLLARLFPLRLTENDREAVHIARQIDEALAQRKAERSAGRVRVGGYVRRVAR